MQKNFQKPTFGIFPKTYLGFMHLGQSRKSAKIELSTGTPQGVDNFGLSTGYPQAKVIHRLYTGLSTGYPQLYPQFHIVKPDFIM